MLPFVVVSKVRLTNCDDGVARRPRLERCDTRNEIVIPGAQYEYGVITADEARIAICRDGDNVENARIGKAQGAHGCGPRRPGLDPSKRLKSSAEGTAYFDGVSHGFAARTEQDHGMNDSAIPRTLPHHSHAVRGRQEMQFGVRSP
jgi:hypothetical protein